jgi:hypothetical protein
VLNFYVTYHVPWPLSLLVFFGVYVVILYLTPLLVGMKRMDMVGTPLAAGFFVSGCAIFFHAHIVYMLPSE